VHFKQQDNVGLIKVMPRPYILNSDYAPKTSAALIQYLISNFRNYSATFDMVVDGGRSDSVALA